MSSDRSQVLGKIRQSLKLALLPSARACIPPPLPAQETDSARLAAAFIRELGVVGTQVKYPATPSHAIETILDLMRAAISLDANSREAPGIICWHDSEFQLPDLGPAVRTAGFVPIDTKIPGDRELRRARLQELEHAAIGLTGALAGLADSGALALLSGPTRPRLASLLPPTHIAVVSKSAIYPTMATFLAAHPNITHEASNLVFITGPSRTADIEQTLTLGVHGPRELFVVLVD